MSPMRTIRTIGIVAACGLARGAGKAQAGVVFDTVLGAFTAAAKTFFGWTATAGDTVTGITYALPNNNNIGVDDARFGNPGGSIPEPATLALFAFGLVGLGTMRRRAKV